MSIAIVVPAFNASKTIADTLQSISAQRLKREVSVVVVNDGSTDDTERIVATEARKDDRIRCLTTGNRGVAAARNAGALEAGSPEYIMFLDADDVLEPGALDFLAGYLDSHPDITCAYGQVIAIGGGGQRLAPGLHRGQRYDFSWSQMKFGPDNTGPLTTPYLLFDCCIKTPGATLIRWADLPSGPIFSESLRGPEDWDLWLRLSLKHQIVGVPFPVLRYRMHSGNASGKIGKMRFNGFKMRLQWLLMLPWNLKLALVKCYAIRMRHRRHR